VSKGGHALAALAVGAYMALAIPHGALLGVATALAAQVPDSVEIVVGFGPGGERRSLLAHRTLSHSPWPWVAVVVFGLLLAPAVTPWGAVAIGKVVAGVGAGALVHLALDLFSPTGIPVGNPFGARVSAGPFRSHGGRRYLYRTSTREEWPLLAPFVVVLAVEGALIGTRIAAGGVPDLGRFALAVLAGA
jgi:membrane-bound metal-dependent hydrolase YbcI (DUF457 family)